MKGMEEKVGFDCEWGGDNEKGLHELVPVFMTPYSPWLSASIIQILIVLYSLVHKRKESSTCMVEST